LVLDGLGVLLGVKSPWVLKKINVQNHTQVIDVYIEYERGSNIESEVIKRRHINGIKIFLKFILKL
jgi:hypothetical protein